jgi:hypothetical protein
MHQESENGEDSIIGLRMIGADFGPKGGSMALGQGVASLVSLMIQAKDPLSVGADPSVAMRCG